MGPSPGTVRAPSPPAAATDEPATDEAADAAAGTPVEAGVNIEMISTSEIRVSVVCRDTDLDLAVRAVHDAFDLGGEEEAVVYAGTGR